LFEMLFQQLRGIGFLHSPGQDLETRSACPESQLCVGLAATHRTCIMSGPKPRHDT
jgi:hypothetical protein